MPERLVSILCLLLSVSVHVSLQNLVSQNTKYQSWLSMVAMISVMSMDDKAILYFQHSKCSERAQDRQVLVDKTVRCSY